MIGPGMRTARLTLSLLLLLLLLFAAPVSGRTGMQPVWIPLAAGDSRGPMRESPRVGRATLRTQPPLRSLSQAATGALLIAKPGLRDPNFRHTVVLLLDYSDDGAMGVILNRPSTRTLVELLPRYPELRRYRDPVHMGGPVAPGSLVLLMYAEQAPEYSSPILDKLYVALSSQALTALAQPGATPTRVRAYAGYAGWGPGQLEQELKRNDWLLWPGDADTVLSADSADLWNRLIELGNQRWVRRQ